MLKPAGYSFSSEFICIFKNLPAFRTGYTEAKPPYIYIWLGFFAYSVLVAASIQLIVLPYIFPAWHAGGGLLKGLDCIWFHQLAVELSQEIHARGWSAWELRPSGQAPSGIAGAIYALTVPSLWTTIPVNAALHATAAFVLFRILQMFTSGWRTAIFFVFPFLMYPSSVTWLSQNHKDGYTIAGAFLFVYGWILLLRTDTWKHGRTRPLMSLLLIFPGAVLCWIVRPYTIDLLKGAGILIAFLATATYLLRAARRRLPLPGAAYAVLIVWTLIYVLHQPIFPRPAGFLMGEEDQRRPAEISGKKIAGGADEPRQVNERTGSLIMEVASRYLPDPAMSVLQHAERRLSGLAIYRRDYMLGYPHAKSYIDPDVRLRNMDEYVLFLPRAAQIAFLSPFPSMWFGEASIEQNTLMRRISAFEMIFLYFCLLGIPFAAYSFRTRPEFWVVMIFCTSILMVYGFGMPNAGTLYRMRYGFIMMIAATGLTGHYTFLRQLRREKSVQSPAPVRKSILPSDAQSSS